MYYRNSHSLSEVPESPCHHSGSSLSEEVFHHGPSQFDTIYSILMQIQVLEKSNKKELKFSIIPKNFQTDEITIETLCMI